MTRCSKTCKPEPTPAGMPVEVAAMHPRYRYSLEPGAQCEIEVGHDGPHRNGGLVWHSPEVLYVGGRPFDPASTAPAEARL